MDEAITRLTMALRSRAETPFLGVAGDRRSTHTDARPGGYEGRKEDKMKGESIKLKNLNYNSERTERSLPCVNASAKTAAKST